jgi:hypothetical protein
MSRGGDRNQEHSLQLLPRSQPTAGAEESAAVPSEDEPESAPNDMSEADANKKIDEEFFTFRNPLLLILMFFIYNFVMSH